jgi:CHAT domain-containing protein
MLDRLSHWYQRSFLNWSILWNRDSGLRRRLRLVSLALVTVLVIGLVPITVLPQTPQHRQAAHLLQEGNAAYWSSRYDTAIAHWEEALPLFQALRDNDSVALVLEGLGLAYQSVGDYQKALELHQQRLELAREMGDRSGEGNALANLGSSYRALGRYNDALAAQQESLVIWQELGDLTRVGALLANMGNVYAELGHYERAIGLHRQSFQIQGQLGNPLNMAVSLNSLGLLSANLGDLEAALQYYEQGLSLFQQLGQLQAVGQVLNNLGTVYHIQGEAAIALDYYQQSLAIARQIGDSHLERDVLTSLGLAYANLEQYGEAIAHQEASIVLARESEDLPLLGLALANLGDTLWKSGDLVGAEQQFRESLAVREALRTDLEDADHVSYFDTQRNAYQLLQQVLVEQDKPEEALEIAERGRARAFAQLLAERANPAANPQAQNLQPPALEEIRRIARQQNATLVEYSIIPDAESVNIGKRLGEDAWLYIWVVQPDGAIVFRQINLQDDALPMPLKDLVAGSRNPLGTMRRRDSDLPRLTQMAHLRQLYDLLIQPIASHLPDDPGQRVIFIPQDSLFLAPLPALMVVDDTYLIEQHTLLTAPSIQVLALTHTPEPEIPEESPAPSDSAPAWSAANALVVGNPLMPSISLVPGDPPTRLAPLPAAEQEAIAIADLLRTTPLLGAAATEPAVTRAMGRANIIHLATHGLLTYGQRQSSVIRDLPGAIALAPIEDSTAPLGSTDGLLTAGEILNLSLNADLVVLSACDTGQGDITGDGVIGLSRSLLSAGASSVVVSLWSVPDAPTADLMTAFYQHLQHNPDKAQALRQAMLSTLQTYPSPIDWAAFTLIGD